MQYQNQQKTFTKSLPLFAETFIFKFSYFRRNWNSNEQQQYWYWWQRSINIDKLFRYHFFVKNTFKVCGLVPLKERIKLFESLAIAAQKEKKKQWSSLPSLHQPVRNSVGSIRGNESLGSNIIATFSGARYINKDFRACSIHYNHLALWIREKCIALFDPVVRIKF